MEKEKPQFISFSVDSTWTLFLDRDGVINVNKDNGYIANRAEFIFKEGVLEAIFQLSKMFGKIIVVTNQRGVGKGLMTESDLHDIHQYMNEKISRVGGRIDHIFYCCAVDDEDPDRKPNPGMAYKARQQFPEIDFSKSLMVGDKSADMQWGRSIGAHTVWISSSRYADEVDPAQIDLVCDSLFELAHRLQLTV